MKIKVLGVGNALSFNHPHTSFIVDADKKYLIDMPPNLLQTLKKNEIDIQEIDNAIITHDHGDHTAGFEPFVLWKFFIQGVKPTIITTKNIFKHMKKTCFGKMDTTFNHKRSGFMELNFNDMVNFVELELNASNKVNDITIHTRRNWHYIDTIGLKIEYENKILAYSGDTKYDKELINQVFEDGLLTSKEVDQLNGDWLWNANLIFHEAESISGGVHTDIRELEALPNNIRDRMRVVHYNDCFKCDTIKCAQDSEVYDLSEF